MLKIKKPWHNMLIMTIMITASVSMGVVPVYAENVGFIQNANVNSNHIGLTIGTYGDSKYKIKFFDDDRTTKAANDLSLEWDKKSKLPEPSVTKDDATFIGWESEVVNDGGMSLSIGDKIKFGSAVSYDASGNTKNVDVIGDVIDKESDGYIIQLEGLTSGEWPGYTGSAKQKTDVCAEPHTDIDNYNSVTKKFVSDYSRLLGSNHLYMMNSTEVNKYSTVKSMFRTIATKASSYGAGVNAVFLGDLKGSLPYYVDTYGNVSNYSGVSQASSCVIAPAFKLSVSASGYLEKGSDDYFSVKMTTTYSKTDEVSPADLGMTEGEKNEVSMYAVWKYGRHTVHFKDGDNTVADDMNLKWGQTYTLPELSATKEHYKFTGWSKNKLQPYKLVKADDPVNELKVGDKIHFGTFISNKSDGTAIETPDIIGDVIESTDDYYVIQTEGLTAGPWPGYSTTGKQMLKTCPDPHTSIDDYNETTAEFVNEYRSLLEGNHLYLLNGTDANNTNVKNIMSTAAKEGANKGTFGSGNVGAVWLSNAGYVDTYGNVCAPGPVSQSQPCVIAPAFRISKILPEYLYKNSDGNIVVNRQPVAEKLFKDNATAGELGMQLGINDSITLYPRFEITSEVTKIYESDILNFGKFQSKHIDGTITTTPDVIGEIVEDVGDNNTGYYTIQTGGLTAGAWPGGLGNDTSHFSGEKQVDNYCTSESDVSDPFAGIDNYNMTTKVFVQKYGYLFADGTHLYLPSKENVENKSSRWNQVVQQVGHAQNFNGFGIAGEGTSTSEIYNDGQYRDAWTGTANDSGKISAYTITELGDLMSDPPFYRARSRSYGIAPAFRIKKSTLHNLKYDPNTGYIVPYENNVMQAKHRMSSDNLVSMSQYKTIIFDTDGGISIVPKNYVWNSTVILPSAGAKSGYTFVHWTDISTGKTYSAGDSVRISELDPDNTGRVQLKAVWTPDDKSGISEASGKSNTMKEESGTAFHAD